MNLLDIKVVKPNKEVRERMVNDNTCPYCLVELKKNPISRKTKMRAELKKKAFHKFRRVCVECKRAFLSKQDLDKTFYVKRESKPRRTRYIVKGCGEDCVNCKTPMERRGHSVVPEKWHYTEWDYCKRCNRVQHYNQFRCSLWKEVEEQEQFLANIK